MALDLRIEPDESLSTRLATVFERATTPETNATYETDGFFPQPFVRRNTQFESLEEFCRACPCERDTVGGVQRLPAEQRDEFVDATTQFESWTEMKRSAAVTDAVTLVNA
jgi:hypothetical protein